MIVRCRLPSKFTILTRLLVVLILSSIVVGCANRYPGLEKNSHAMEHNSPSQKAYFQVDKATESSEEDLELAQNNQGSLWVDTYSSHLYNNLYRANKVGDTVMIMIDEESQGSGTGNTKSDKKATEARSISGLGGLFEKLEKVIKGLGSTSLSASNDSKFQGKAATDRSGKLLAKLSAQVTKVLRNGNMAIRGEQHIKVNKEEQVIVLEGLIRPYDILPNNTVMSSSIADAKITYSGFGVVADRQSPGWLVRVLDKIWPL